VIGFLRHEVALTSALLDDVSAVLIVELGALVAVTRSYDGPVARMTEAIQREDLIQQRLKDLDAALGVLEQRLADACTAGAQRDHALGEQIAARLQLGETRARLMRELGRPGTIADHLPPPRAGEVDLF
jgi:hypothetical protein